MKIALTTFISGEDYQDWIPFILYSIYKSYPEYYVFIFVNEPVRFDIKQSVDLVSGRWNNFEIVEDCFREFKVMDRIKAQSVRWVLWSDKFREFDYLYYIDADILYVKEPIPLHEQHIRHMHYIGHECISNIVRRKPLSVKNSYDMYQTVKWGG